MSTIPVPTLADVMRLMPALLTNAVNDPSGDQVEQTVGALAGSLAILIAARWESAAAREQVIDRVTDSIRGAIDDYLAKSAGKRRFDA